MCVRERGVGLRVKASARAMSRAQTVHSGKKREEAKECVCVSVIERDAQCVSICVREKEV